MNREKADETIEKIVNDGDIKSVLGIGAGSGFEALYCAEKGIQVDAVDPSGVTVHKNIRHLKMKAEEWCKPQNEKKYDLIILRSVLHFLKPEFVTKELLPKINSLLNENGFVYILLPHPVDEERYNHSREQIREALQLNEKIIKSNDFSDILLYSR